MNHDKPVEELIFELGNRAAVLFWHELVDLNEQPFHVIQENYDFFKTRALKLGVDLPGLTEGVLSRQFLDDQISKVREYINLHKTESMLQLYELGYAAEQFFRSLVMVTVIKKETKAPLVFLQDLIKRGKDLGVDIGDQLEVELKDICDNYMNFKFDQDFDSIRVRLKMKVCGLGSEMSNPSPKLETSGAVYKRSEVDPTRVITDECWTVSLVRLPDRSNSEHAFIVLEGKTGRMSKIWFADFVAVHWFDTVKPGTEEGKVRMESYESEAITTDRTSGRLLFKCQKRMMNVRASDRLLFSTWLIAKSAAGNLIRMIEAQQQKPRKYHMLGDNSVLAGSSARSSSNPNGHNCFTFAKMMLRDLNDPFVELPEDGLETWIGSATSRYLVDKQLRSRKWYKSPSFLLSFGFLTGIIVAYFLLKTF